MKTVILRSLAALCCIWATTAFAAKIILAPPQEVPFSLNAAEFSELTATRNKLLTQQESTQEKIDTQARECHDVVEGSLKVDECMAMAQEVRNSVRSYRNALELFKTSIATSLDLHQAKSRMRDELSLASKHRPQPIGIESHGEFYVTTADGKKLTGALAAHVTEDDQSSFITGSNSGAVLTLPNNTRITLGSNTEYLTHVPDQHPGADKQSMSELLRGTLRWVHETSSEAIKELNENDGETRSRLIREGKIRVANVAVAVRGTDFECAVLPDGSGYIKLYSGAVDLTSQDGGEILKLLPGKMVTIRDGKLAKPVPIQ
jgi:hypothetical protein